MWLLKSEILNLMTLPEGTKVEGWWLKVCGLWLVVGAGAGCQRTTNNKQRTTANRKDPVGAQQTNFKIKNKLICTPYI